MQLSFRVAIVLALALSVGLVNSDVPRIAIKSNDNKALPNKELPLGHQELVNKPNQHNSAKSFNLEGKLVYSRNTLLLKQRNLSGDYVHIDTSGSFTKIGKWSTAALYVFFWLIQLLPRRWWGSSVGRSEISIFGGVGMVIWRYVLFKANQGPEFCSFRLVFHEPLVWKFALLIATTGMDERESIFSKTGSWIKQESVSWRRFFMIMVISFVCSMVLSNDLTTALLSGAVVDSCVEHKVSNPMPYMLALSTFSILGAALTKTGSISTMLITTVAYDEIEWLGFMLDMFLPVTLACAICAASLFFSFRSELRSYQSTSTNDLELAEVYRGVLVTENDNISSSNGATPAEEVLKTDSKEEEHIKWTIWSVSQVLILLSLIVALSLGVEECVSFTFAGLVLMALTIQRRNYISQHRESIDRLISQSNTEATPARRISNDITNKKTILSEVKYTIFIFLIGQFLIVGSLTDTGIPQAVFNLSLGKCAEQLTEGPCLFKLSAVLLILCNIFSSLSVCQMSLASFPYASPYIWIVVSFATSISGNLTLLGSASGVIVSAKAKEKLGLSGSQFQKRSLGVNFVSTLIALFVGMTVLSLFHASPECSKRLGECVGYYEPDHSSQGYYDSYSVPSESSYYGDESSHQNNDILAGVSTNQNNGTSYDEYP